MAACGESDAAGIPDEDLIRRSVAALNDVRANLTLLTEAFDRLYLDEDLLFGARGFVCARWTLRGIHVGDYGGIAPTNRDIAVESCEIYAVAGGKVVESWVYSEMTSLFDQIAERP